MRSFSCRPRTSEESASDLAPPPRSISISAEQLKPAAQTVPQRNALLQARTVCRGWRTTRDIPGRGTAARTPNATSSRFVVPTASRRCGGQPLSHLEHTYVSALQIHDVHVIEQRRSHPSGKAMEALQKHRHTCTAGTDCAPCVGTQVSSSASCRGRQSTDTTDNARQSPQPV
jgi:hypothetical protein